MPTCTVRHVVGDPAPNPLGPHLAPGYFVLNGKLEKAADWLRPGVRRERPVHLGGRHAR